jgi:hypothetical protein
VEYQMKKVISLALFVSLIGAASWAQRHTLSEGTEIKVRTDTPIPAHPTAGARYTATVSDDVPSASGGVAIPKGSRAALVASPTNDGKDSLLDLHSVAVGGRAYLLEAAGGGKNTGTSTLGANRRTAKYVGGGAVVGTLLGALLGGGKGAAIGALAGGAAGAGTQVYTGKKRGIPAETQLTYKVAQPLTMRVVPGRPRAGLQRRPGS